MTIQLRKPPTKKLPHEKLRDIDPYTGCVMIGGDEVAGLTQKEGNIVASEIEKYYDPKPRDIKGNPVYKGMEVEGGTVHTWCVFGDGSWDLYDEDYVPIQSGGLCDLIRLPEPKVLDADGVPTKKGETVWYAPAYATKDNAGPWKVLEVQGCDSVLIGRGYLPGEDDYMETVSGEAPDILTHREPDSLEKLRDDIDMYVRNGWNISQPKAEEFANRLTAIMERDA